MSQDHKPPYVVRPSTALLTRGFDPALSVGSARPAVFRSSTYVFETPEQAERSFAIALGRVDKKEGEEVGLIYSRLSHPNAEILEDQITALEPDSAAAAVFNSGLAAISTLFFTFCPKGSSFVFTNPVYGGTHHLMERLLAPYGIQGIPVAAGDTAGLAETVAKTENLKMVYMETPANPTLVMSDIAAAVQAAQKHKNQPLVAVDNTFMGPAFQHPLSLGADLVVYSATKFLAGFSDMLGGVIMAKNREHVVELQGTRAILGNILQPDESWMLNSRIPTVMIRMNRQSKNAQRIAEKLQGHEKIEEMLYPSMLSDPEQKRIFQAQCDFPGSMLSFRLKGGKKAAFSALGELKLIHLAVSLGGMESLACHPASTTHSEMSASERTEFGVTDDLIRFSIGLEDWQDLYDDIGRALKHA